MILPHFFDEIDSWLMYLPPYFGVVVHTCVVIGFGVRILQRQSNHGVAVAWLVIILAMPVLGIIGYILFGETNLGRRYVQRNEKASQLLRNYTQSQQLDFAESSSQLTQEFQQLSRIAQHKTGLGVFDNHRLNLLTQTDEIFDHLLADITHAKTLLMLEFYIIYPKGRVLEILEALLAAAARGVECHVLADSVGSYDFFRSGWVARLRSAGITVTESLPVGLFKTLFKRVDLRNHRKLLVVDTVVGYTGSFNLVDPRFFKQNAHVGEWVDVMMRIENHDTTNVVKAMAMVVMVDIGSETEDNLSRLNQYINRYTKRLYSLNAPLENARTSFSPRRWSQSFRQLSKTRPFIPTGAAKLVSLSPSNISDIIDTSVLHPYASVENVALQLIPSAPELISHVMHATMVGAIYDANERVVITTPYFIPDDALMLALTTAAARGVAVTLILPKKVDSFLVRYASQAYFEPLLKAGVTIALFTEGLLHTKTLLIDEEYCLFGTVNMDMRSFYLNMEVCLAIYNRELVAQVADCQQRYLAKSELLNPTLWQNRRFYETLWDNTLRLFSPLL